MFSRFQFHFGPVTDLILLPLVAPVVVLLLAGLSYSKSISSVISNRIRTKFDRILLQVNMHQLMVATRSARHSLLQFSLSAGEMHVTVCTTVRDPQYIPTCFFYLLFCMYHYITAPYCTKIYAKKLSIRGGNGETYVMDFGLNCVMWRCKLAVITETTKGAI